MKKPVFPHNNLVFTLSWILTLPILIDICTACTLFSFWLVWLLYFMVIIISCVRLFFGFKQKCYKFSWTLIAELIIGGAILLFFQMSFNDQIKNALNHSVKPDVLEISNPVNLHPQSDSLQLPSKQTPVNKIETTSSKENDRQ